MLYSNSPIIQPCLEISPIWYPLTDRELHKLIKYSFTVYMNVCAL
jgi:hypothetical protein